MAFHFESISSKIIVDGEEREVNATIFTISLSDMLSRIELIPGYHPRKNEFGVINGEDHRRFNLMY